MPTRTAAVQLPLGQLVVLGMGALCIMNPEKTFLALHKFSQVFLLPSSTSHSSPQQQQPIVIHQAPMVGSSSSSKTTTLIQVVFAGACCWGSYVLLMNLLPDQFRAMLPVTQRVFSSAIASLGKAVLNLKETFMEQVSLLSKKQDELGQQQEETHVEVLNVKDSVGDLKGDLQVIQESLNLCHSTLSESDRKTAYIAHGVQLLTRGVSTFLPQDDALLKELQKFNTASNDFKNPAQLSHLRQLLRSLQSHKEHHHDTIMETPTEAVLLTPIKDDSEESSTPSTTPSSAMNKSVVEVQALLETLHCGQVM